MIDITDLLSNKDKSESIRYAKQCSESNTGVKKGFGPVIAWNITRMCNYKCKHCYSNSNGLRVKNELSIDEIYNIVDQFKEMNVPVILLSGGEPLMREGILDIIKYIRDKNIRVSLSTNGSLIDKNIAYQLKDMGISYVGISIDGTQYTNDIFRGVDGAYVNAIRAIENCKEIGQKVGLRFTLQRDNYKEVPDILKLMEEKDVERICFYHLVPTGRGKGIEDKMLTHGETKEILDFLYTYSKDIIKNKKNREILTVANHSDGPYIYLKLLKDNPEKAQDVLKLLLRNRGNRSGMAIANVDWEGNVYPDQFSKFLNLGNLKKEKFKDIWNKENQLMTKLRNRKDYITGKCSKCRFIDICNGNLRARSYSINDDLWAEDPACYLGEDDIC
ncbi:radical SAM/SPASM domain-containing protein [Clostridiisalibacter paucivorans]|uniref:radical SAM/SPASM domain-containing protein n=1 Tax=Clostridiisalibacter paucivorans TaxID=408753 RepID=UPI000478C6E3|nr:radical SAM protein [Clostridiisalibacter paucivorans]